MSNECVFCQIAAGKQAARVEYEDEDWIVFHDIKPSAPVHVLLVPKEHVHWSEAERLGSRACEMGRVFELVPKIAKKLGIKESGFRLVMNGGKPAGQIIDHFHLHMMSV